MSKVPKLRFPEFEGKWEEKELGEVVEILNNKRKPITNNHRVKGNIPYYGASGIIDYVESYIFNDRILLIGEDGAKWGAYENTAFIVEGKCWVNNHAHVVKAISINDMFLKNYLNKVDLMPFITGSAPPKLTLGKLKSIRFLAPSIEEQQKIADCLSSLDELIEARREKIASLKTYKKGLLQQLFPQEVYNNYPPPHPLIYSKLPKLRFAGFEGEWEEKKLGFFIKQKNDRNKKLHIKEVLSINNKKGFITQEEQFNGYEVASKNLSNYKIVKKGYFGYNPSRINVGSIAELEKLEEGIVSPMYIVFEVDDKLNSSFLLFLFETKDFKDKIKENAIGSVRDTLDFKDLSNFSFFFPTTEEQQKIADCLLSLDEKIAAETEQVAQLQQHKKGLLQQLLV